MNNLCEKVYFSLPKGKKQKYKEIASKFGFKSLNLFVTISCDKMCEDLIKNKDLK